MKTKTNRIMALILALVMVLALAACGDSNGGDEQAEVKTTKSTSGDEKKDDNGSEMAASNLPEKITIMVDGTLVTKENGREAFEAKWEELTGVELEIIQPDHDAYTDVVGQTFASGAWPDVILLNSAFYAGYASEGVLWDMTDAYANSDLKASGRIKNEALVEGLKLNDALYGISPSRGNGCVTYVKQAWLDNVGMEAPTTYDEYIAMLDAFTNGDPDANGVDGDTYGMSSAGLVGKEIPFINYNPEFWQEAFPSFYLNDDGVWVDGFTEPELVGALQRLSDSYEAGYIDKEALTNGTKDCRNKYYEDKYGVFTYWAGTWASNLSNNLIANDKDGELVALEPIAEVGQYLERQAPVWAITAKAEDPQGVFDAFFETMLDGGEVQKLWTYGVEGVHWSTAAEEVVGKTYAEGEFHMLENMEKPGTQYKKNHIDPMNALTNFTEIEDPGQATVAPEARKAAQVFNDNSRLVELVPSNEIMSQYNGDLVTLKREIVANVVTQGASIESEMARFKAEGGAEWSQLIVDALNGK